MKSKSGRADGMGDSNTHIRRILGASSPNVESQRLAVWQLNNDWVAVPGIPSVAVRSAWRLRARASSIPLLRKFLREQSANTLVQSKGRRLKPVFDFAVRNHLRLLSRSKMYRAVLAPSSSATSPFHENMTL